MDRLEIEKRITAIVAEQTSTDADSIPPEAPLAGDSLDHVEIVMFVEDEFKIIIPDEEAEELKTVRAFTEFVEKALTGE